MAFTKYREVTKHFHFTKIIDKNNLPKYITDYISDDEDILAAYQTHKDIGIFTSRNIVLFDNSTLFGIKKNVMSISYKAFQTLNVSYLLDSVEFSIYLNSGYPLILKFANTTPKEKTRIRRLFFCIKRSMNGLALRKKDITMLDDEAINNLQY